MAEAKSPSARSRPASTLNTVAHRSGLRGRGSTKWMKSQATDPPNSTTTARSRSNSPITTATKPSSKPNRILLQQPARPMIGLELGTSVASAALRKEPTGAPVAFRSDVVATAKTSLEPGTVLDGEGGYCVWGKQMPSARSLEIGGLPLGLASNVKVKRKINQGRRDHLARRRGRQFRPGRSHAP